MTQILVKIYLLCYGLNMEKFQRFLVHSGTLVFASYLKLFLHIFKQDETDSKTASPWKVGAIT